MALLPRPAVRRARGGRVGVAGRSLSSPRLQPRRRILISSQLEALGSWCQDDHDRVVTNEPGTDRKPDHRRRGDRVAGRARRSRGPWRARLQAWSPRAGPSPWRPCGPLQLPQAGLGRPDGAGPHRAPPRLPGRPPGTRGASASATKATSGTSSSCCGSTTTAWWQPAAASYRKPETGADRRHPAPQRRGVGPRGAAPTHPVRRGARPPAAAGRR